MTQAQLLARKDDLLDALRLLAEDRREGAIDEEAYFSAYHRYELEAAAVLEQLDRLQDKTVSPQPGRAGIPRRWLAGGLTAVALAVAVIVFLTGALQPRSSTGTVTGSSPQGPASSRQSQQLLAAEQQVEQHPGSAAAFLALGNVYLDAGQSKEADNAYQKAMRLAPGDPQPITLHAMVQGFGGKNLRAVQVLHQVEAAHPRYARAWLLNGLFSANGLHRYHEAIAAWRHFLSLQPAGPVAAQVHAWIKMAHKAAGAS